MKIGRLRIGKTPCSDGKSFSVAAWQHACGYWRWSLHWSPREAGQRIRFNFGPTYAMGTRYWLGRGSGHFGAYCTLPLIGSFSFQTQPPLIPRVKPASA